MTAGCICISREDIGVGIPRAYATWLAEDWKRGCPVCSPKCLIVSCDAEPVFGNRLCLDHHDWAVYELADEKYRTREPPSPIGWKARDRSAVVLRLFS